MAWSSSYLSADEWADYQANMPLIVASSALKNPTTWAWNAQTGKFDGSETNYANASFPTRFAADGFAHALTSPTAHATGSWYFLMAIDPAIEFDSLAILGHNFSSIYGGDVSVFAQISANDTFLGGGSSGAATVVPATVVGNDKRLTFFELNHDVASGGVNAQRYSGVQYARIGIATDGLGNFAGEPAIGEVILGRRRQLHSKPDVPWDDLGLETEATDFVSESGVISRFVHSKGRSVIAGNITFANATRAAVLRQAYVDADFGTTPVLLVSNPAAARGLDEGQQRPLFGMLGAAMSLPLQGPYKRTGRLDFTESAPYFATET